MAQYQTIKKIMKKYPPNYLENNIEGDRSFRPFGMNGLEERQFLTGGRPLQFYSFLADFSQVPLRKFRV